MVYVTDNRAVSEAFTVTNREKQGFVLALTLYSLMFSTMLMHAYRDECLGIRIVYWTDGCLFNSRCSQVPTLFSMSIAHYLLLTDDCVLKIATEADMSQSTDLFTVSWANFGMTINTDKAVVMHQPSRST
ncbi:unnamed protein product [Schistocephalus solidus]|uniref:Reverse transcriptase domain-containing protein n=1 Tax=Schistocephalus solidus TaxID=70667 RepID=A0A183TP83_SCHSO|nr:unnamed protein product [Schistocephalus solidus]